MVRTDQSSDNIDNEQVLGDDSSTDFSNIVFLYDDNECMQSRISIVSESATVKPSDHCRDHYQHLLPLRPSCSCCRLIELKFYVPPDTKYVILETFFPPANL